MVRRGPVLVTGGFGFIGSYITRELARRGREIVVFSRSQPSPETTCVLADAPRAALQELGSVEDLPRLVEVVQRHGPSVIVHAAANVDTRQLLASPYLAYRTVLDGTMNVFEAARLSGVERVVNVSSIGVLPTVQYQPIDVAHPLVLAREGPGSGAYGVAKAAGELFGFAYTAAFGLDVRTVRPSAVYGFGMRWHSANYMKQFVEPAVRGEAVRIASGGSVPRDYTHVVDVATLIAAVIDAPDTVDRAFYAATGRPLITASQVAKLVMELVPGSTIEIADGLGPDDAHELAFRGVLSIRNAQEQLGWEPAYPVLEEGVAEYISRYRSFLAGPLA